MTDKSFEEGKKLRDLETQVRTTLEQFRDPATSNFARDSLMTIATQSYIEYLRLSVEYQVPIREVKSVTGSYLGILDEWVKREGSH
ncbi:MAG: hypothetical protein QXF25_02385 [Candidatus Pacearchaeota archaeon]